MAHRRHHRTSGRSTPWRYYLLIAAACAVLAAGAHFLFGAPQRMREMAEEQLESAVREAVHSEVHRAASERAP